MRVGAVWEAATAEAERNAVWEGDCWALQQVIGSFCSSFALTPATCLARREQRPQQQRVTGATLSASRFSQSETKTLLEPERWCEEARGSTTGHGTLRMSGVKPLFKSVLTLKSRTLFSPISSENKVLISHSTLFPENITLHIHSSITTT